MNRELLIAHILVAAAFFAAVLGFILPDGMAKLDHVTEPRPMYRCNTCTTQSADMAKLLERINAGDVTIGGPGAEAFVHRLKQIVERNP